MPGTGAGAPAKGQAMMREPAPRRRLASRGTLVGGADRPRRACAQASGARSVASRDPSGRGEQRRRRLEPRVGRGRSGRARVAGLSRGVRSGRQPDLAVRRAHDPRDRPVRAGRLCGKAARGADRRLDGACALPVRPPGARRERRVLGGRLARGEPLAHLSLAFRARGEHHAGVSRDLALARCGSGAT